MSQHPSGSLPAVALSLALTAAAACAGSHPTGTSTSSATGASTTASATSSTGTGGSCAPASEAFGSCSAPVVFDGGPGSPGTPCETDTDCGPACCPCSEGQTLYAYATCQCGRCASVCDPTNDTRAPACQDAGPVVVGCLSCSQILNEALAEGEQLGPLACAGAAAASWSALSTCVAAACASVCSGIMPASACVSCFEQPDAMGGCATEATTCVSS